MAWKARRFPGRAAISMAEIIFFDEPKHPQDSELVLRPSRPCASPGFPDGRHPVNVLECNSVVCAPSPFAAVSRWHENRKCGARATLPVVTTVISFSRAKRSIVSRRFPSSLQAPSSQPEVTA